MVDLTWTNTWLAILAVISLIQFLAMCVAGILAYRMYQRAMNTLEAVERVHIAPLRARVDAMLDQVQLMTDKVRHAQESVSDALRHVSGTGSAVAGAVKSKAWPIVGILQGLKSVANSMMGNGRHGQSDKSYGAM
jgi:methyl-accepting chemotaxis protein